MHECMYVCVRMYVSIKDASRRHTAAPPPLDPFRRGILSLGGWLAGWLGYGWLAGCMAVLAGWLPDIFRFKQMNTNVKRNHENEGARRSFF